MRPFLKPHSISRFKTALLWVFSLVLMLSFAVYQRRTGPTYPKRGRVEVAGKLLQYRLIRTQTNTQDARVAIPEPGAEVEARIYFRRFNTGEPFRVLEMRTETGSQGSERVAYLPAQPPAGKLEYDLRLQWKDQVFHLPGDHETCVIRFKGPVSTPVLLVHVILMFSGVLVGLRAGLGALMNWGNLQKPVLAALLLISLGGLVFGPLVQKAAFGHYWTGWPFGGDLTDNKTLFMWLAWALASCTLLLKNSNLRRWAVVSAALIMSFVYLVPHSMRGSELDYQKLEQGASLEEAIGTGR